MIRAAWKQGLLVSVRSAEEASIAIVGGAAIIDVNDPSRGALGRADPGVTAAVIATVAGRAAVTLACGELAETPDGVVQHLAEVGRRLPSTSGRPVAVKLGPFGVSADRWGDVFAGLLEALPADIEAVAVAYADWEAACTAPPGAILTAAAAAGATTLLVDTHDKAGAGLFGQASVAQVRSWVETAHAAGMRIALAGRLAAEDVETVFLLGADVAGVRSAACVGGRHGRIDGRLVEALVRVNPAGRAAQ